MNLNGGYQLSDIAAKLLRSSYQTRGLQPTLALTELLFDSEFIKAGTFSVLRELMHGPLEKYVSVNGHLNCRLFTVQYTRVFAILRELLNHYL